MSTSGRGKFEVRNLRSFRSPNWGVSDSTATFHHLPGPTRTYHHLPGVTVRLPCWPGLGDLRTGGRDPWGGGRAAEAVEGAGGGVSLTRRKSEIRNSRSERSSKFESEVRFRRLPSFHHLPEVTWLPVRPGGPCIASRDALEQSAVAGLQSDQDVKELRASFSGNP